MENIAEIKSCLINHINQCDETALLNIIENSSELQEILEENDLIEIDDTEENEQ